MRGNSCCSAQPASHPAGLRSTAALQAGGPGLIRRRSATVHAAAFTPRLDAAAGVAAAAAARRSRSPMAPALEPDTTRGSMLASSSALTMPCVHKQHACIHGLWLDEAKLCTVGCHPPPLPPALTTPRSPNGTTRTSPRPTAPGRCAQRRGATPAGRPAARLGGGLQRSVDAPLCCGAGKAAYPPARAPARHLVGSSAHACTLCELLTPRPPPTRCCTGGQPPAHLATTRRTAGLPPPARCTAESGRGPQGSARAARCMPGQRDGRVGGGGVGVCRWWWWWVVKGGVGGGGGGGGRRESERESPEKCARRAPRLGHEVQAVMEAGDGWAGLCWKPGWSGCAPLLHPWGRLLHDCMHAAGVGLGCAAAQAEPPPPVGHVAQIPQQVCPQRKHHLRHVAALAHALQVLHPVLQTTGAEGGIEKRQGLKDEKMCTRSEDATRAAGTALGPVHQAQAEGGAGRRKLRSRVPSVAPAGRQAGRLASRSQPSGAAPACSATLVRWHAAPIFNHDCCSRRAASTRATHVQQAAVVQAGLQQEAGPRVQAPQALQLHSARGGAGRAGQGGLLDTGAKAAGGAGEARHAHQSQRALESRASVATLFSCPRRP